MTAWLTILAIGISSYALRAAILVTVAGRPVSERVLVPLGFVGPAALAALTAALVFTHGGAIRPLPAAELVAVVAGTIVVRRTGAVLHAFAVGLPVFWALTALGV